MVFRVQIVQQGSESWKPAYPNRKVERLAAETHANSLEREFGMLEGR